MSPNLPPSPAQRLLRLALRDPEWQESVLGDLDEEFALLARRHPAAARRWYWRQAVAIALRMAAARVIPSAAPRRPARTRLPDVDAPGRWGWGRDLAGAWRGVTQRPAVSAAIIGTLALALAANATIFGLVDALYLRPYRFSGVERLVVVASTPENDPSEDPTSVAPADFRDWARESTTLTDFAAASFWDPNMSGLDDPEQVPGFRVSPGFFRSVGAEPLLGRTFLESEAVPGRDRQVVIGHGLWVRRFGADPGVIGRSVRFDGDPYEIVGVMRPGLALPFGSQVWAPLALTEEDWTDRRRGGLMVVARLADRQTLGSARAELSTIVARQRQQFPETHATRPLSVRSFTRALSDGFAAPFLAIWQAAALVLLLIACANIANLLLARGTERQQEFAVRLALGASRRRIAGQLLFEGAWLAGLATLLALPLAAAGIEGIRRGMPPGIHRWVAGIEFMQLDVRTLAVTAALAAGGMVVFSWGPAMRAARAGLSETLHQGGRSVATGHLSGWLGTGLAAAQVALTLALLVGAGLVLGGVHRAVHGALGFDKTQVLTAELTLPTRLYADAERRRQFVDRVATRLAGIPAVEVVGAASTLPYAPGAGRRQIYPEGAALMEADAATAGYQRVSPSYFEALRIPLLEGRAFGDEDREATTPVVIVSGAFAARHWPGESALGRRFRTAPDGAWLQVIGVCGDVVTDLLLNRDRPMFYRPLAQDAPFTLALVVRTHGDPLLLAGELRRAIAAADPDQPVLALRTMAQVVEDRTGGVASLARALGAMSAIALLLALTGIYSLISYLTASRTREFGVRLALGATPWTLIQLSGRHVLVIIGVGLAAGAALGAVLIRVMSSALFGLVAFEVVPVAVLIAVVGVTALAAGILPARRAAGLDPTEALRAQ